MDTFVRLALERSPSLAALEARHASARYQVAPAGALPDPMVGAMYQSMGPPWAPMAPMSMAQIEISQSFPGFGKRQARRAAAQAEVAVRDTDLTAARARLAAEVRSTYATLYAIDRQKDALEAANQLLVVLVGAVTGRYATGMAEQEALAKAELERSRLKEQLVDLSTERSILVARLNQLASLPESTPLGALGPLPQTTFDVGGLMEQAVNRSPELRVQRAAVTAAARRVESARLESRPNFLAGLAGGATTTGEPMITLRFGIELPIWSASKQDPMIRAAAKDVEAAHDEYRAAELRIREQVTRLQARWTRDTQQIEFYRGVILPQARMALGAAENAYSTGRSDFATVIEDFRIWLEAQTGLARREADKMMTWAELQALVVRDEGQSTRLR